MATYMCENGTNVDLTTSLGETALSFAAARGHCEAVQYLIKQQHAEFQAPTAIGFNPAELAKQLDHERLCEWLMCQDAKHAVADSAGYAAYLKQQHRAQRERTSLLTPEQVEAFRTRMRSYDNLFDSPRSFQFTRLR